VDHSRRRVLGLAGVAMACAAGASAGVAAGWVDRAGGWARSGERGSQESAKTRQLQPLWRFPVANPVAVTLTAAGPAVFVSCQLEDKLYALNAENGSVLWEALSAPGASAPVTHGNLAYVMEVDSRLSAVNITSGEKLWDFPKNDWTVSGPVLGSSVAYVSSGPPNPSDGPGEIWALDAQTGRPLWRVPSVDGDSPFTATREIVYTSSDSLIRALSTADGAEQWKYYSGSSPFALGPQLTQDIVYISCNGDSGSILSVLDASTGELLWSSDYPAPLFAMQAVAGNIYTAGNNEEGFVGSFGVGSTTVISAAKVKDGRQVWRRSLSSLDQAFVASGTIALTFAYPTGISGGIAYPGGEGSETELLALSLSDGRVRWRTGSSGWSVTSPPFLAGNWACVGYAKESIRVVNLGTGKTKWNFPMAVVSGPVAYNGRIFAVGTDGIELDGTAGDEGYVNAMPL